MKKCALFLTLLCCILYSSCDLVNDVVNTQVSSGTLFYWISSDADTYVECSNTTGACTGGEVDHSGYDFVAVSHTPNDIKRAYINFPKPAFPPGTVINEAYFELYHSGKNEDGKRDDILLDVNRVHKDWNAGLVTYANQPIPTGNGGEFYMKLESQNWSGTTDIGTQMQQDIITNDDFNGFLVSIQSFDPGYDKGFHSPQTRTRTLTDLGLAPRLLLRVTLPAGFTTNDVQFNTTHTDGLGGSYVGFRFRSGGSWPADWKLANQN
jgi:hypothetical protein